MVPRNCESWEEEMYWKKFNFARFTLTLPCDFHHRLMLPKKFTNHMRTQLPEKVVLEVNGLTWNVDLQQGKNDVMLQGNGWQKFAKAYSLKKSDILMIEYDRHECFKVFIFDHANSCEKEASHFMKKYQQPNSNDGDSWGEEFTDRNQGREGDCGYTSGSRLKKNSTRARKGYFADFNDIDEGDETSDKENSISAEDCTTPKKASTYKARKRKVSGEETTAKKKRACVTYEKSNRRLFTEEEKKNALEKARETCTQHLNSFFVVMRPTSVYEPFIMSISWEWKPGSVFKNKENVILKVEEKIWVCRISLGTTSRKLEGAGWKRFALENLLEEYDVCLFVPSGSMEEMPVLEVSIFRVLPQAVQPSPVISDDFEVYEITSEDSSEGDGDSSYVKRNKHRKTSGRNTHTRENLRHEDESDESSDGEKSSSEEDCTPKTGATLRGRKFSSNVSRKRKHYIAEKSTTKENSTYRKSSARNITEADKERVLKMAKEKSAQYKTSFIEVMKKTSVVSRRFFLSITKDWNLRHNMRKGQEVILQLKGKREKTWTCKLYMYKYNVGLQGGWKRFVLDNKLKTFDVCLFVPAQENEEKCILDVHIFRVRGPAVV